MRRPASRFARGWYLPRSLRVHLAVLVLGVVHLAAAPGAAAAQTRPAGPPSPSTAEPEFPRPGLPAGTDPWDAESYLEGVEASLTVGNRSNALAKAYWATRLDPTSAPALLTLWHLRWLSEPRLRARVQRGDARAIRSPEAQRIDSLHLRAMIRDPFVVVGTPNPYFVNAAMVRARAELAKDSSQIGAYIFLATQHYHRQAFDSTVFHLRAALRALDRLTAEKSVPVYESREIFHYAIGRALYKSGDVNAARAEYAQAATEALGFYPAHAELGTIAWTNWSDLAMARQEFELALEIRDDAVVRYDYGTILLEAREVEAALAQFDRAIALEPYFAHVRYNRAVALDRLGRPAEALEAYRDFLAQAPRRLHAVAGPARARVAALEEAGGAAPPR